MSTDGGDTGPQASQGLLGNTCERIERQLGIEPIPALAPYALRCPVRASIAGVGGPAFALIARSREENPANRHPEHRERNDQENASRYKHQSCGQQ